MVVESMLGLDSEPADPRIHLRRPRLPSYINWLKIRSLRHADAEQPRPPGYRIEITGDARACRSASDSANDEPTHTKRVRMSVLKVDQARARRVFSQRTPEPFEIRVLMLFKTPADHACILAEEFGEALDDGTLTRETAARVIERLRDEAVLVPAAQSSDGAATDTARAVYFSHLASIGRLTQGLAGDLISMADDAERNVQSDGQTPAQILQSIVDRLRALKRQLDDDRDRFVVGQMEQLATTQAGIDKIHLGSGQTILHGWANIDMIGGDIRLNLCWRLPFDDQSVRLAFSAHTFEHFDYHTAAPRLLAEVARILKPGGTLRLVVPDIGAYTQAYAQDDTAFFNDYDRVRPEFGGAAGYTTPLAKTMLMGGSAVKAGAWFDHKMGYDFETLAHMLRQAGFSSIERRRFGESQHTEFLEVDRSSGVSRLQFADTDNSLFVEASK